MLGGMLVTFLLSVSALIRDVEPVVLFDQLNVDDHYLPYLFVALPFFLTSFGFHGNVPSLMKYYGKKPLLIQTSILTGSLLALVVYAVWQTSVLGNITRVEFQQIISDGGNIGTLISVLRQDGGSSILQTCLGIFANLAVATSFLGVSLGLFDYIADTFGFGDDRLGRLKTAGLTFLPPILCSLVYPDGFLHAIGFAGMGAAIFGAIVPGIMVVACRRRISGGSYRVWGGDVLAYVIVAYGIFIFVCHFLSLFEWLQTYS